MVYKILKMKTYTSSRKMPKILSENDKKLFAHEIRKEIKIPRILLRNNLYTKEQKLYIFKFFRYHYSQWRMSDFSIKFKIKFLIEDFKNYVKKDAGSIKEIIFDATWVIDQKSWKYFHWLTDTLQRYYLSEKNHLQRPIIITNNFLKYDYVVETLKILNIPHIVTERKSIYKIKHLTIPEHVAPSGNYDKVLINTVSSNLKNAILNETSSGSEPINKLWISRQSAQHRKIKNFNELIDIVEAHSFEIIKFEDFSLTEQIKITNKAHTIMGLHGAGLTNMLFMEKGSKVIEIRDRNDDKNNCFFTLASDLELNYYYFLGDSVEKNNLYASDYIINPEDLNSFLTKIE
jgi:capsular polysaccharide biosynthesis protein